MVVPKHVLAGDIEKVFDERGGKILESYELFDIYEGAQIKVGFKSLAYKLTFRAKDRTLEEADITVTDKDGNVVVSEFKTSIYEGKTVNVYAPESDIYTIEITAPTIDVTAEITLNEI